jgi:hypothetical protein
MISVKEKMWIIPFYRAQTTSAAARFPFQTIQVFLSNGGTAVWTTEPDEPTTSKYIEQTYLHPNGLFGKVYRVEKEGICYVEIDRARTKLSDFYTWNEFLKRGEAVQTDVDLWRPFAWLGSAAGGGCAKNGIQGDDSWGWATHAAKLSLGAFGSVERLWTYLPAAPAPEAPV